MALRRIFERSRDKARDPSGPSGRLIHIGPFKTGTTTVQSAFHRNRVPLAEHGIHYVGLRLQPAHAIKAMTGVGSSGADQEAGRRRWAELAEQARHSGARHIVISSEFLCEADDNVARRIIEDLGGPGGTQVVVTLRPLAAIIPSQWQQFVQSGTTMPLADWTEAVLARAAEPKTVGLFWRRHRHDELVRRWAGIVGASNVTVIAMDSRDKGQLTREFARLLDLPDGLLIPASEVTNRSLTWEETEAIRAFNGEFERMNASRRANGEEPVRFNVEQRLAAWDLLKERPPALTERKIQLPPETADRIAALSHEIVDNIVASGVALVGDTDLLRRVPTEAESAAVGASPPVLSAELAARIASGVLRAKQDS